MENPIKMDDLGVSLFSETSIYNPLLLTFDPNKPNRTSEKFEKVRENWSRQIHGNKNTSKTRCFLTLPPKSWRYQSELFRSSCPHSQLMVANVRFIGIPY